MPTRRSFAAAPSAIRKEASHGFFAYALVFGATLLVYLPALGGGLLWDDTSHVTRTDLRSLHGLWRIWFDPGATQQYYPLLHSAFWVEHAVWGDSVFGYHLVNILLHALSACLVVRIVRRLALPGAWLAGLFFAVHPLCVEAVAWISEQKSTLSGFFCLAAALVYLDFDRTRRRAHYYAALVLFVLGLLSKTVVATLPMTLLVLVWWTRGRIEGKRDLAPLLPWFVLGAAAGIFTAWVETHYIGAHGGEFALTPIERLLVAGRAFWFYVWKIVWPIDLAFFYPRWSIDAADWSQYLFPAAALGAAVVCWRIASRGIAPRRRAPLTALLVFAITLFPALGFFNVYPFRYSYAADHFAYLASLAILIPGAALLSIGSAKINLRGPAQNLPAAIMIATLALLTGRQAATYRNEETLYRATLARNPGAWLAHNNLGNILLAAGDRDEAVSHIEAALRLKPDFWEAHLSLANTLLQTPGRLNDAIGEYEIAARLAPQSERTHTNLGNALLQAGRTDEAIAHLQAALRIDPNNAEAHNDLGNAFTRQPGRLPDAIAEYRAALRGYSGLIEAHDNLGRALAQSGRLADAIAEFETAIHLQPDYWPAHSNLGNALSLIPRHLPEAIGEYQAALRIHLESATVHNNLGYALSQIPGRLDDAIAEYRHALQLEPASADAHYNLAAALLRSGNRREALREFETVLRLRPNPRVEEIVTRMRAEVK